jgi:hypothetical protein
VTASVPIDSDIGGSVSISAIVSVSLLSLPIPQDGGVNDSLSDSVCFGIAVPLFNLVWHDCMVIPWSAQTHKGDWGIPGADWGFLHAILNGGTCYISENADAAEISQMQTVTRLQARVADQEMLSHEFIGGDIRHQRSVFADGTAVEVNFDTDEWKIY